MRRIRLAEVLEALAAELRDPPRPKGDSTRPASQEASRDRAVLEGVVRGLLQAHGDPGRSPTG